MPPGAVCVFRGAMGGGLSLVLRDRALCAAGQRWWSCVKALPAPSGLQLLVSLLSRSLSSDQCDLMSARLLACLELISVFHFTGSCH